MMWILKPLCLCLKWNYTFLTGVIRFLLQKTKQTNSALLLLFVCLFLSAASFTVQRASNKQQWSSISDL